MASTERSMTLSQLLDSYGSVVGITSTGHEAAAATALNLAESTRHPLVAPVLIPPYFTVSNVAESAVVPAPSQNNVEETIVASTGADPDIGQGKIGSAASQAFRSLVERSIVAWKSISYKERDPSYDKKQAIERHSLVLGGVGSLEALFELQDHQFWFFQRRESFVGQSLFQKWDPDRLDDYILLPVEGRFANQLDCIFISHYWHTEEHPDRQGEDLRLFHQRLNTGIWSHVSYFWVDWTCMPQLPRTKMQQQYFKRALGWIPMLVRDCTFTWWFPRFEPRLWILFEVAEFALNRSQCVPLADVGPFISHLSEMKGASAKFVIDKYGYTCTNQSDSLLVAGWLEILLILYKIIPSIRIRRHILNTIDNPLVRACHHKESGIEIDKEKGVILANGTTYQFTPIYSETADNSTPGAYARITGDIDRAELSNALQRAKAIESDGDYKGVEELAREFDREGEYKIAEELHRRALAGKKKTLGSNHIDTLVSVIFLAEILEKQGQYKEAEELRRREVAITKKMHGRNHSTTLRSRKKLAGVVQKQKQSELYHRWKLEPIENVLSIKRPDTLASSSKHALVLGNRGKHKAAGKTRWQTLDQSVPGSEHPDILTSMNENALKLEEQSNYGAAKEIHWQLLERKKKVLGADHLDTLKSMYNLARVLRIEGKSKKVAEKLYWLALAINEKVLGPEHPDTLGVMSNLAVTILLQGKRAEAKEMCRQQLEREVKVFGWNHPNTYASKHNLRNMLNKNEVPRISRNVDLMGAGEATVEICRR